MRGGNYRTLIPFLKKTGFIAGDGTPTSVYQRFRNSAQSGSAAAEALRTGYAPLFTMNENADKLPDNELRGLMVQATGLEAESRAIQAAMASFKVLRDFAGGAQPSPNSLQATPKPIGKTTENSTIITGVTPPGFMDDAVGLNIGYTINLNLPATTDINVFNAIFRSLKENLLKR